MKNLKEQFSEMTVDKYESEDIRQLTTALSLTMGDTLPIMMIEEISEVLGAANTYNEGLTSNGLEAFYLNVLEETADMLIMTMGMSHRVLDLPSHPDEYPDKVEGMDYIEEPMQRLNVLGNSAIHMMGKYIRHKSVNRLKYAINAVHEMAELLIEMFILDRDHLNRMVNVKLDRLLVRLHNGIH